MVERITNFYNQCIGTIETDGRGDKIVKDFYGRILGKYEKSSNLTKDFYEKILYHGDMSAALLVLNK